MPNVTQIQVMNQTDGPGGHESCGYHSLKNTLLSLMWSQKLINDQQFKMLREDKEFFKALFNATKTDADRYGNKDLTLTNFQTLVQKIQKGTFDFSNYGITNEAIQALNLDQHLISLQTHTAPGMNSIGLSGELLDMEAALALARLAKIDGEAHYAFALGLNDDHWVTAVLNQDKKGARTWHFMDSWRNQTLYKELSINKIESILNKTEPELREYLIASFEAWNNAELFHRYNSFFDAVTGKPKSNVPWILNGKNVLWDASDYFVKNKPLMQANLQYILIDFQFAQGAGWLTNPNAQEKEKLKILYQIAQFMLVNAENTPTDKKAKIILKPICDVLNEVLSASLVKPKQPSEQKQLLTSEEVQEEVTRIKDNRYSVRGCFDTLLPLLLPEEVRDQERITVSPTLIDENNLQEALSRDYPGKEYVVLLYAHKPHSPAASPYYPEQSRAHTSVILCKVHNGIIQDTLNIDGYHNLGYVDIMGERPGAIPNPNIKQRLVLTARPTNNPQAKTPLQTASWHDMNCSLYAFTITQQLLKLYQNNHEVMNNVFNDSLHIGPEANKNLLQEAILDEMVASKVYVTKINGEHLTSRELISSHHNAIREQLAAALIQQNNPKVQSSHEASNVDQSIDTHSVSQNQEQKSVAQSSGLEARPADMSWDVYLFFSELYQQKDLHDKQKLYERYLIATNYQDRHRTLNGTSIAQLINNYYPYLKDKLAILDELTSADSKHVLTHHPIKVLPRFVRDQPNFAALSDVDAYLKEVLSKLQKTLSLDPGSLKKKLAKLDDIGAFFPINGFLDLQNYIQNNSDKAKAEYLSVLRTAFKTIITCRESLRSESEASYSPYFVTLERAVSRLLYEIEQATYHSEKQNISHEQDIKQSQHPTQKEENSVIDAPPLNNNLSESNEEDQRAMHGINQNQPTTESTMEKQSQRLTHEEGKKRVSANALKKVVHDYLDHLTKKLTENGILVSRTHEVLRSTQEDSPVIKNQIKRYNAIFSLYTIIKDKKSLDDDDINQALQTVATCTKSRPAWSERPFLQRLMDILSFGIRPLYRSFFSKEVRLQQEIEHAITPENKKGT